MKLITILATAIAALATPITADAVKWERLEKNNTLLLIVDHQTGLFGLARDANVDLFYHNVLTHAALGKLFDLPVIMTTSAQTGPNGPLPKAILDMYPDAPLIQRQGEVSAWDNAEFRAAVRKTGKKQIVLGGIVTDVCTTFLALALREEGYSVYANVEASGTTTDLIRESANDRMRQAGVYVVSLFYILGDLFRDWRNVPGAAEIVPWMDEYFPSFTVVAQAHAGAVKHGELIPGENDISAP